MKKKARMALHGFVWLTILAGCVGALAALGLFGALWRFFKWVASI